MPPKNAPKKRVSGPSRSSARPQVVVVESGAKRSNVRRAARPSSKPSIGRSLGSAAGGLLGGAASSLLGSIFGMGAYSVKRNVLFNSATGRITPPPLFQSANDGSVWVCAREYVTEITGAASFSNALVQRINPSNRYVFPRLSQLAPNYEMYDFQGLVFEFVPSSGVAVSTASAAMGTVILATQYDVLDAPFANKVQMEAYMFSTAGIPNQPHLHPIECAPRFGAIDESYVGDPSSYVAGTTGATGSYPTGADPRMYEKGLLQVSTQGQQSAYVVGELWVSYCVKLSVPRYNPYSTIAHVYNPTANATGAAMFTGAVLSSGSDLQVTVPTATTLVIPSMGFYILTATWSGVTIAAAPAVAAGANITNSSLFGNTSVAYTSSAITSFTSANASLTWALNVTANGVAAANTITFSGLTGMAGACFDVLVLRRYSAPGVAGGF